VWFGGDANHEEKGSSYGVVIHTSFYQSWANSWIKAWIYSNGNAIVKDTTGFDEDCSGPYNQGLPTDVCLNAGGTAP